MRSVRALEYGVWTSSDLVGQWDLDEHGRNHELFGGLPKPFQREWVNIQSGTDLDPGGAGNHSSFGIEVSPQIKEHIGTKNRTTYNTGKCYVIYKI